MLLKGCEIIKDISNYDDHNEHHRIPGTPAIHKEQTQDKGTPAEHPWAIHNPQGMQLQ